MMFLDEKKCDASGRAMLGFEHDEQSLTNFAQTGQRNIVKRSAAPYDDNFARDHPSGKLSDDNEMQGSERAETGEQGGGGLHEAEGDEDFLDPAQALVKNNPLIMEQLGSHVQAEVSEILGNSGARNPTRRYPVLQILQASLEVMKVGICFQ